MSGKSKGTSKSRISTVWRIHAEDNTRVGMYRMYSDTIPYCPLRCPGPKDEPKMRWPVRHMRDYHYGFKSIPDMMSWFDNQTWVLKEMPMCVLSKFTVPNEHVVRGTKQVAFILDEATLHVSYPCVAFGKAVDAEVLRCLSSS